MTFIQNSNPNYLQQNYYMPQMQPNNDILFSQSSYVQNPYQASFYNQAGLVYPYSLINNTQNAFSQFNTGDKYTFQGIKTMPNGENIYLYKLKSGLNVAIIPMKNIGGEIKCSLNGGAINETDDIAGISHMIEHEVFKGSSKLQDGDVFKMTARRGHYVNASTDYAETNYYRSGAYFDDDDLKETSMMIGSMVSSPNLDDKTLNSEKEPVKSEISMMDDTIDDRAYDRAIRNLFQIKSNAHNIVAGSIKTVSDLSSEDLKKYYHTNYDPNEMYVTVVGDVNPQNAIKAVTDNFNITNAPTNRTARKLTPIISSVRQDIKSSKTNVSSVFMAFSGPKPQDAKDFIIGDMLNYYLKNSSSLGFNDALDNLCGSFDSSFQKVGVSKDDPYAIINMLSLNSNEEQKGIDLFYDTISAIQQQGVSDDDLTAIKNNLLRTFELDMSQAKYVCDMFMSNFINGTIDSFSNYKQIVEDITSDDIKNYINKYLNLNKVSMVVVHPSSVSDSDIMQHYNNSKYSMNAKKSSQISFTGAIPNITTNGIIEETLSNGTKLAISDGNSKACAFKWSVDTPHLEKPKNPNIPAALTFMLHKQLQNLNKEGLEKSGVEINVEAYGKSIEISANCLPQYSAVALNAMNQLMYLQKLSQEDFISAKKYIKDVLNGTAKDADSPIYKQISDGYFASKDDMLKNIDKLTLNDVQEFYVKLLNTSSSSFASTVPMDEYSLLVPVIKEYQNNPYIKFKNPVEEKLAPFKPNEKPIVIYDTDDLNQAQIVKSYTFELKDDINEEAKYELVNEILGGSASARLFQDLRDKQNLAYSVYSSLSKYNGTTGVLNLEIQTTTDNLEANVQSYDNVQKSLEGFKKHTDLLCNQLVGVDELNAAKAKLKQDLISRTHHPIANTELMNMNMQEKQGINRINMYLNAIDNITPKDIQETAKMIFANKPRISILASKDTINSQMEYLKTQGKMVLAD